VAYQSRDRIIDDDVGADQWQINVRAHLTAERSHPATAVGWFTHGLGFATHHPEPGK
jgi:hypothetical protein